MAELQVVIKGTQTIEEYKRRREELRHLANKCYYEHLYQYELNRKDRWPSGKPVKVWRDSESYVCVEYESGECWHYEQTSEGLRWW